MRLFESLSYIGDGVQHCDHCNCRVYANNSVIAGDLILCKSCANIPVEPCDHCDECHCKIGSDDAVFIANLVLCKPCTETLRLGDDRDCGSTEDSK